jgi:putative phosphoesterase
MIIHAGDLTEERVLEELKAVCSNVRAVRGNMDPEQLLKRLPEKEIIPAGKYRIGLTHGWGAPAGLIELARSIFKNERLDIIVFGHSHSPLNEKRGDTLFFNPGSPTDKVFAPYNSYGIIEINDKIEARIVRL